jgi:predicted transcriptional regulator
MILDEEDPIGRKTLAQYLKIGEGSTRTILSILQTQGLITIGKNGITLTQKGADSKSLIEMDVARVEMSEITIGKYDCMVHLPFMARKVRYGCEERDAAIKAGALGATTLVCTNKGIRFPGDDYPVNTGIINTIHQHFNVKEGDAVIIGTADDPDKAEIGAVTVGIKLVGGLQMNRELRDILTPRSTGNELLSLAFAIHDLVGGLPVCAKSRDNLGLRIENGAVIDNAYTGEVLEDVIEIGTTIRKIAVSGPYKGIRVIVTPVELDNRVIAAIGVVDIRSMAGVNNLIRLNSESD